MALGSAVELSTTQSPSYVYLSPHLGDSREPTFEGLEAIVSEHLKAMDGTGTPSQLAIPSDEATTTSSVNSVKVTIPQDLGTARKSKSRYGCRGCKARRLKCDETKPDCLQCLRRGRQCPGYKRDFKFSDKHEKLRFVGNDPPKTSTRKRPGNPQQPKAKVGSPSRASSDVMVPESSDVPIEETKQTDRSEDFVTSIFDETPLDIVDLLSGHCNRDSFDWPGTTSPANRPSMNDAFFDAQDMTQPEADEPATDQRLGPEETIEETSLDPREIDLQTGTQHKRKRRSSNQLIQRTKSRIPSTPIDLPTTLIEYWFTHVCSMWSAYDSETNPNRQLALSNCFISEPVFYALQSMSAACLVDSLPHLKPVLASTSGNALAAINRDMEIYYDLTSSLDETPPTDLLLAIFAMATSLCWTDTKQLGEPLIVGARTILMRYQEDGSRMHGERDRELSHFSHALKYTEMLLNFVSSESAYGELETMRTKHRKRLSRLMKWNTRPDESKEEPEIDEIPFGPSEINENEILHPWTGISRKVQEQFGLVMALCRDHHMRRRQGVAHGANALCESLCDIEVARELASDLTRSEYDSDTAKNENASTSLQTGDSSTPLKHLLDTAEAYRLAALLQLYITFSDLEVRLDETETGSGYPSADDLSDLTREQALKTLTLLLVDVLQRIPADSGTRCIQPVLYVSAATGLRFDVPVTADPTLMPLTHYTIEVSRARKFVVDRLAALLRSLPPRPISVALNLVKAIWTEYDYGENGMSGGGHWLDVMMNTGLHTLFG